MATTPPWILAQSPDAVTVALSTPVKINGVMVDNIRMDAPTVMLVRGARKVGGGDDERVELILFANLINCAPTDLEAMRYRDYRRLQAAYFRLLADDEGSGGRGSAPDLPEAAGTGDAAE